MELIIIIAVFVAIAFGTVYNMIKHSQQMPEDYGMNEWEVKLKNEIENENSRKAQ